MTDKMPPATCPRCLRNLDAAGGVGHDARPRPDDLTVCIYCTTILAFTADFGLRPLTKRELEEMPTSEMADLRRTIDAIERSKTR